MTTPITLDDILDSEGLIDSDVLQQFADAEIRRLACDLAEPALAFAPAGETRPAEAIRVARAFADGGATLEDLRAAHAAALGAVCAPSDAAWAAANAAVATCSEDAAVGARSAQRSALNAAWASARDAAEAFWEAPATAARKAAAEAQAVVIRRWLAGQERPS